MAGRGWVGQARARFRVAIMGQFYRAFNLVLLKGLKYMPFHFRDTCPNHRYRKHPKISQGLFAFSKANLGGLIFGWVYIWVGLYSGTFLRQKNGGLTVIITKRLGAY